MGKHPTYTMAHVVRMAQVTVRTVCRDITFRRLRLRPPIRRTASPGHGNLARSQGNSQSYHPDRREGRRRA